MGLSHIFRYSYTHTHTPERVWVVVIFEYGEYVVPDTRLLGMTSAVQALLSRIRPVPPAELPLIPVVLLDREPHPDDALLDDMVSSIPVGEYTDDERRAAMGRAYALEVQRRSSTVDRVLAVLTGVSGTDCFDTWCPSCYPTVTLSNVHDLAIVPRLSVRVHGLSAIHARCARGCGTDTIALAIGRLVAQCEHTERATARIEKTQALAESARLSGVLGDHQPQAWAIPGLVAQDGLTILAAEAGSGKTWLALHAGICVATGTPWLLREIAKQRTLILLLEGSRVNLRLRIEKLCAGMEIDMAALDGALDVYPDSEFAADTPEHVAKLAAYIEALDYKFVVIDNLTNARSNRDENSAAVIGEALRPLAAMCVAKNIGILLLHNTNAKGDVRGSSAIKQHGDLVFEMARSSSANTSAITVTRVKDRTGESTLKRRFRYVDVWDEKRTKIVAVKPGPLLGAAAEDDENVPLHDMPRSELFDELLNTLPATAEQIYRRIHRSRNVVFKARTQLERNGVIAREGEMFVRTDVLP